MAIESIDNVLEQLVLSGAVKVDMDQPDPSGKPGRCCPNGSWHAYSDASGCDHYEHLTAVEKQRLQMLSINPDGHGQIHLMFDPSTRRIQATEISELESGYPLLTLFFWPGLETAHSVYRQTIARWQKAIADGWFEGVE